MPKSNMPASAQADLDDIARKYETWKRQCRASMAMLDRAWQDALEAIEAVQRPEDKALAVGVAKQLMQGIIDRMSEPPTEIVLAPAEGAGPLH